MFTWELLRLSIAGDRPHDSLIASERYKCDTCVCGKIALCASTSNAISCVLSPPYTSSYSDRELLPLTVFA